MNQHELRLMSVEEWREKFQPERYITNFWSNLPFLDAALHKRLLWTVVVTDHASDPEWETVVCSGWHRVNREAIIICRNEYGPDDVLFAEYDGCLQEELPGLP